MNKLSGVAETLFIPLEARMAMNKNERQSIRAYNKMASNYDNTMDGKITAKFKKKMVELCDVEADDKVLDIGCGNGALINAINNTGDIRAYGIDISPNMIAECKARYKDINFDIANGEALSFKAEELNTITLCCVLHHLNDVQKFMKEARRVLKQGGSLIIGEPIFILPLRKSFDWFVAPILRAGDNNLFSRKRLERLLTSNGFEITETYKKGHIQILKARKGEIKV